MNAAEVEVELSYSKRRLDKDSRNAAVVVVREDDADDYDGCRRYLLQVEV